MILTDKEYNLLIRARDHGWKVTIVWIAEDDHDIIIHEQPMPESISSETYSDPFSQQRGESQISG